MAVPILITGNSGTGKSASLRNCVGNTNFNVINVLGKPFPFRGGNKINSGVTDDYAKVESWLKKFPAQSIVIDDAGYLITNMFMRNHSNTGGGNSVFSLYNTMADKFWGLIEFIKNELPAEKIVYIIMHEDTDDFGNIKPKTVGKLLDEKVNIQGLFTIVLRCVISNGKHVFVTQSTSTGDLAKSPIGMFDNLEIDNDLAYVDKTVREYLEIPDANNTKTTKKESKKND